MTKQTSETRSRELAVVLRAAANDIEKVTAMFAAQYEGRTMDWATPIREAADILERLSGTASSAEETK